MIAHVEVGVGHHHAAEEGGDRGLAVEGMGAMNEQAGVDRRLARLLGIDGDAAPTSGGAAAQPPLATARTHVDAG